MVGRACGMWGVCVCMCAVHACAYVRACLHTCVCTHYVLAGGEFLENTTCHKRVPRGVDIALPQAGEGSPRSKRSYQIYTVSCFSTMSMDCFDGH